MLFVETKNGEESAYGDMRQDVSVWDDEQPISDMIIASAFVSSWDDEDRAKVWSVFVEEDYRRRGIARVMVEQLCAIAKEWGKKEVWLYTYDGEKGDGARACYRQVGFADLPDNEMLLDLTTWEPSGFTIKGM